MRLIDADALIEKIYEIDSKYGIGAFGDGLEMAKELVLNMPTIETERPHGVWKPDGTCSECGVYSSLNKNTANFCPNCGSDNRPRILDESVDGEGKDGNVKEGDQNDCPET